MARPVKQEELDDVLDKALDDFEEDEAVAAVEAAAEAPAEVMALSGEAARAAAEAAAGVGEAGVDDELASAMAGLMAEMKKPTFATSVDKTMRELSGEAPDEATGPSVLNPFGAAPHGEHAPEEDTDKNVSQALEMMAQLGKSSEGVDAAGMEGMGEEVMKRMMQGFEKMGEKEDFQSIVDGMMKQLLSKDIMYEPMKQICDKYPEWLADNEPKLSKEEYTNFGRQYQYFQQIVAVYETEPDNFPKLMELMQDMQETGQPPSEIIKELAPGLQFTEDGMPMLPNMGAGVPGMPQIPGMGGGTGGPGGCSVM